MGQIFDLNASPLAAPPAPPPLHTRSNGDETATLTAYKAELDHFRSLVAGFENDDPGDILPVISGIAGRVAEIRADLVRVNTPRCARLRTTEVDPFREDLDFQFRLWSRKIALLEWELRLAGGGA